MVLALFPAERPEIIDVVEIDEEGKIQAMYLKPGPTDLHLCWLCGIWTPVFTQFMHEFIQNNGRGPHAQMTTGNDSGKDSGGDDVPVGAVLQAAIQQGLNVYGVVFTDGKYLDIGTPENLMTAIERYGCHIS